MEENHNWKIREDLLEIEVKLLTMFDFLSQTDQILASEHNTSDDILLELVLANMRDDKQNFCIKLQRKKNTLTRK